ncbi:MAG: RNA polymerase sigma factor [Thiohalomonadales bacterium]
MNCKDLLQHGYRYAYSLTHTAHDAEDLVQEAWVKLMSARGHVDSKSLLFVTIRNLYIDQYRRNNIIVFDSMENIQEPAAEEKTARSFELHRDLNHAFQQLRMEESEAIFLNVVMGYSAEEIAKLTKKSRNTVLSLISRGKKKLADYLRTKDTTSKNALL